MADLALIRAGLAANLAPLRIQVSPYMLSNPTPPAAHVFPAQVEYDLAMSRGLDKWSFTVQVFVGATSDKGAQVTLDAYLASSGAKSVKTLLESDSTLGGAANDVVVQSCSGYSIYTRESGGPVLGAEWLVEVLATGT